MRMAKARQRGGYEAAGVHLDGCSRNSDDQQRFRSTA
jgi:hypothetical protein